MMCDFRSCTDCRHVWDTESKDMLEKFIQTFTTHPVMRAHSVRAHSGGLRDNPCGAVARLRYSRLLGCHTHGATYVMHALAMRATPVRAHAINWCARRTCAHDACSSWRAYSRRVYVWPQRARLRCVSMCGTSQSVPSAQTCNGYKHASAVPATGRSDHAHAASGTQANKAQRHARRTHLPRRTHKQVHAHACVMHASCCCAVRVKATYARSQCTLCKYSLCMQCEDSIRALTMHAHLSDGANAVQGHAINAYIHARGASACGA
eukprot:6174630-Pleurochrysis_carterae.AAC.2